MKTLTFDMVPPPQEEMDRRSKKAEQELIAPLRRKFFRNDQCIPSSVDLTTVGSVSPVKDQGRTCGSCAVFAAVSTIESCKHKVTGTIPTDLSEQHLMDCAYNYTSPGIYVEGISVPGKYRIILFSSKISIIHLT